MFQGGRIQPAVAADIQISIPKFAQLHFKTPKFVDEEWVNGADSASIFVS